jgi:diguanylate cyclase (GGDEF)-like protein
VAPPATRDPERANERARRQLVALAMLEIPAAVVLVFDRDLRIVMIRGAAAGGLVRGSEALEGRRAPDVLQPQKAELGGLFEQACAGGVASATWQSVDGSRHYLIRTAAVRSGSGEILGGVCLAADISDLRIDTVQAHDPDGRWFRPPAAPRGTVLDDGDPRPMYDALTGLPTEVAFRDGLSRILSHPPRRRQRLALVYLGMDGLTAVNEQHGQAAGDRVLVICSRRIRSLLRADDLLARLDGDEFVALVTAIQNPSDARRVTDHVHSVMSAPIPLEGGQEVSVSMSIGLVMVDPEGSVEDAIQRGRSAMTRAKAAGGAGTVFSKA